MSEWYRRRLIGDVPGYAARRWGAREALSFEGIHWTHEAVSKEVDELARALIALGVRPHDKVAIWLINRPEFLFLFYAVIRVGAVAVPLNTRYRTSDVEVALIKADCSLLISVSESGPIDYASMLREALPNIALQENNEIRVEGFPHLRRLVLLGEGDVIGAITWEDFRAGAERVSGQALESRATVVDPDEVAMIIFTSGTTAAPKGVMHSHICTRAMEERSLAFGINCTDAVLNYLPLFHIFGISLMLSSALTGARQVLTETFDARMALELIERERVTMTHGFDTHWLALLEEQTANPRKIDSLRLGLCPSGTADAILAAYKVQTICQTMSAYGMTECWSWNALSFANSTLEQRCETSGVAMPDVEFRIVDPRSGSDVEPGDFGEIYIKSYSNMLGYYKEPEATAEMFHGEWLCTGDKGRIRPDGFLQFVGRYKDMLKVGGENVAPAEVEAFLMQVPEVLQVAVVGIPDSRLHEVPVAFVIARYESELGIDSMMAFCKGRIASFKTPRHFFFVKEFPTTSTGKVQKAELRRIAIDMIKKHANTFRVAAAPVATPIAGSQ